jgi:putative membrane protein
MQAETFFTEQEKVEIEAAIREVERITAGEVAVMVVDRSDSYPEAVILGGISMGTLAGLLAADILLQASLWYFVPLAVVLSVLFGWLTKLVPALLRLFVPASRLEEQVRERAVRSFYEKELYNTRDDTGVLFFISLLEHKVWVLADKGIYSRITQEELQSYASRVAQGIRDKTAAPALCEAIRSVGQVLAEHFPVKEDDTNELSNRVIID